MLFLFLFTILYCIYKYRSLIPVYSIVALVIVFFIWNQSFNLTKGYGPWHTAYIGIGAYPNDIPGLYNLSDNRGYEYYKKITGKHLSASIDGEYSTSVLEREKYLATLKKAYFKIVRERPLLIFRNAFLNGFQGYALGYISGTPFVLHLFMALIGFSFFMYLLVKRWWIELLAIGFSHASFTFFYPPVQNYYFGTVLLIVVVLLRQENYAFWINLLFILKMA